MLCTAHCVGESELGLQQFEAVQLASRGFTRAGVKVGPDHLLHTPVDSLAQVVAEDAGRPDDAQKMQV